MEAVRNHFGFLHQFGYEYVGVEQFGMETHVVFRNNSINREIRIIRESYIIVKIERKRFFSFSQLGVSFDIAYLFDRFGSNHIVEIQNNNQGKYSVREEIIDEIIRLHAEFCREHLMTIIIGEKWIDDIVNVRKLEYPKFKEWPTNIDNH